MSNIPMSLPDLALAIHEQKYSHSVSFVGLTDGRILMYGGGAFSVSSDGGITWGEPYRAKDTTGEEFLPGGCVSMVNLSGNAIGLAHARPKPGTRVRKEQQMIFRTSEDEGKTFSEPVVMNDYSLRATAYQDTFLRTQSGRLILPVYFGIGQGRAPTGWHHEAAGFVGGYMNGNFISCDAHFVDPHFGASYVLYSDDEGKTWQPNEDGELFIVLDPEGPYNATFEPSICEVSPGKLLMIMRTNMGRLFQAWSQDNGDTWSRPVATQLAGTHAPGQIRKLTKSGHLLCVWTQQSEKEIKQGFIRTRLSAAISRNGGGIWEHFQNVESIHEQTHVEPGPIRIVRPEGMVAGRLAAGLENDAEYIVDFPEGYGRWSYPSVFVAEDRVLISHTYSAADPKSGLELPRGGSKLKVLPISWFYGGQEPFESPLIEKLAKAPSP